MDESRRGELDLSIWKLDEISDIMLDTGGRR